MDPPACCNKKCIIISVLLLGTLLVLGTIMVIVLLSGSGEHPKEKVVVNSISEKSEFPEGSFKVEASALKQGNPEAAPKNVSKEALSSWGVKVEDTSFIAESGRLTFLYVWLPAADVNADPTKNDRVKRSPLLILPPEVNIGIQFKGSSDIAVVPLDLASTTNSGLREVVNLREQGKVYEVQVRMPVLEECSNEQACFVSEWQPYVIGNDNRTAVGADTWYSLPVSCGSQCDSPSGSACSVSCKRCDAGQTVAGADTPVTRRFKMGASRGNFTFGYETYTIKDRVTILHEGRTILDSSCVGTRGFLKRSLTFSGRQKEVVVNIEPNCQGTTGTKWYFSIGCPEPCSTLGINEGVRLFNGLNIVQEGGTVYIDANGNMPRLEARACGAVGGVNWSLWIGKLEHNRVTLCQEHMQQGTGSTWSFAPANGGPASLSWETADGRKGSINFRILGTNPDENSILSAVGSNPWYAEFVARHQNYMKQFDNLGKPSISGDGGVGIFQLTQPIAASCSQVWNWRNNVAEGAKRLSNFAKDAKKWMEDQRQQAKDQNGGRSQPVPKRVEANCVFEDGTWRTIEDAVALKLYNGASMVHYAAWDNGKNQWKFNPVNNMGRNYVERVCSLDEVPVTELTPDYGTLSTTFLE